MRTDAGHKVDSQILGEAACVVEQGSHHNRRTSAQAGDTTQTPTADHALQPVALIQESATLSKGQLVKIVQRKLVSHIIWRNGFLRLQVEVILRIVSAQQLVH